MLGAPSRSDGRDGGLKGSRRILGIIISAPPRDEGWEPDMVLRFPLAWARSTCSPRFIQCPHVVPDRFDLPASIAPVICFERRSQIVLHEPRHHRALLDTLRIQYPQPVEL